MSASELASLVSRLEAAINKLEKRAGGDAAGPTSEIIEDYDAFVTSYIDPFIEASNIIPSDDVKQAASLVKKLVQEQRKFLEISTKCSAPSQGDLMKLLASSSAIIQDIGKIKDKTFKDKQFSYFTEAINEGVTAFGWVAITPAPAPYVKECSNSVQFYTNKILKEQKEKDAGKQWVKIWLGVFNPLHDYVKNHHRTGVSWNKSGPAASPTAAGGAPPPPPPPPPPSGGPPPSSTQQSEKSSEAGITALLTDLNKGAAVTKGLKKVTDDMKTHKNPNLRLQSAVPYKGPAPQKAKPVPAAKPATAKPPKLELQGKKWIVEFQKGRNDLEISGTEMKHTVYIYKCENCTIQIKGKINSITLDNCKKTGIVFDSIVSGIDFVNCQSVQAQVKGALPIATIDKTDGCLLYLSKESLGCQIISAKSSEMNISIPLENGEFKEYAVVEQFRTVWDEKTKSLVTEPSENAE